MKRYAIWNKKDMIITPIGEVLTAEQWFERYPIARLDKMVVVCAFGDINGGFFGILSQMKALCEAQGADFSKCETNEDVLNVIEAFENKSNEDSGESTPEERIAAALEYQNLLNTNIVNDDDPDLD